MACHMYGTGRGGTTDNFLQVVNYQISFCLRMTVVGTLRKNKPEIPALFLS